MSSQEEGLLFFRVLIVALFVIYRFTYFWIKQYINVRKTVLTSGLVSFALFFSQVCGGIFASDGVSQVIGWFIFGVVFVLANLVTFVIVRKNYV